MLKLGDKHWKLFHQYEHSGVGFGYHFNDLSRRTGISKEEVRELVHDLRDAGYLQFQRGCTTDEGDFYGSAYVLTVEGQTALRDSLNAR